MLATLWTGEALRQHIQSNEEGEGNSPAQEYDISPTEIHLNGI